MLCVLDAWSWEQGHNVKQLIIYSAFPPAWVRTDKKDMFIICYICSESTEGWGESVKGKERRGEGKVRNVFKCKDHKFNTFPRCERRGGRS